MKRKLLVADLLCGAGGSSTGCARALAGLGLEMELVCVNHWPTAIETHRRNHPEARHYVQDISTVRPHILVPEGYLDLLMASPTCTHHSVARGGKPTSDQQRSDPWHIITWLTELRVKRIIIENVWEFCGWGPVDHRTGKPVKSRKGEYFHAWIETLKRLGFDPEWRKLNAANYGGATTRQRFILKARNDRKLVRWAPLTHAKHGADDLFADMKPWRPARDIIDWSIRGKSIFDRPKPLAPKTLARIYAGAVKFRWPEPFLVVLRNHMGAQGLDQPLPTIAANGTHIGLAEPVIVNMKGQSTATGVGDPLPTQTAHAGHLYAAEPVIMNGRKGNQAKPASTEPVPTLDTKGGVWLAEPMVLSQHNSGAARSAGEPLPTITTGGAGAETHVGCARPMLVEPFILNRHGENGGVRAHPVAEPMPTANCRGAGYVVEPFVVSAAHGVDADDPDPHSRRVKSVDEPLGTIHAGGGNFGVAQPFVLSQASGGAPRSASEPLPTIVTGGERGSGMALIMSYYGASQNGAGCISGDEPLPTVTAKDRFGMVVPITHADGSNRARDVETDPLPTLTTANRGELAFITAQHGERSGQAPRVHDVDLPAPTIAATGHVDLVEGTQEASSAEGARGKEIFYDILFRMLEPHELAAAMGFNTEDQNYEFAGTKTEMVKQIGNAVSVEMMEAEVRAIMADAAPKMRELAPAEFREAAE
jgi:DNA (cytosine-5)-methyltransferase 1